MMSVQMLVELRSERDKLKEEINSSVGVVQTDRGYVDARYARAVEIQKLDRRIEDLRREIIKEVRHA